MSATSEAGEGWTLVTSGTKRKAPTLPKVLQLQNRFTGLKVEEEPDVPSTKGSGPHDHQEETTLKKEQSLFLISYPRSLGLVSCPWGLCYSGLCAESSSAYFIPMF